MSFLIKTILLVSLACVGLADHVFPNYGSRPSRPSFNFTFNPSFAWNATRPSRPAFNFSRPGRPWVKQGFFFPPAGNNQRPPFPPMTGMPPQNGSNWFPTFPPMNGSNFFPPLPPMNGSKPFPNFPPQNFTQNSSFRPTGTTPLFSNFPTFTFSPFNFSTPSFPTFPNFSFQQFNFSTPSYRPTYPFPSSTNRPLVRVVSLSNDLNSVLSMYTSFINLLKVPNFENELNNLINTYVVNLQARQALYSLVQQLKTLNANNLSAIQQYYLQVINQMFPSSLLQQIQALIQRYNTN